MIILWILVLVLFGEMLYRRMLYRVSFSWEKNELTLWWWNRYLDRADGYTLLKFGKSE
jgi:hypothetical protein